MAMSQHETSFEDFDPEELEPSPPPPQADPKSPTNESEGGAKRPLQEEFSDEAEGMEIDDPETTDGLNNSTDAYTDPELSTE